MHKAGHNIHFSNFSSVSLENSIKAKQCYEKYLEIIIKLDEFPIQQYQNIHSKIKNPY